MTPAWRGILPIVVTPFTETGLLDVDSLSRQVHFCIEVGAAGLVGPANASEFSTLSDDERRHWLEVVLRAAEDAVPVVAAITSGHALPAAELGRFAQQAGAAGVMAMPPHVLHEDESGCYRYFETLSRAVEIPLCVQNFCGPVGTPMSADLLATMCRDLLGVDYIKEETHPEPRQLSRTLEAVGTKCRGVFGGQGGLYLLDEHRRGCAGNMPGSHTTDVLVEVWRRLECGEIAAARELFGRLAPLMNYERLYGVPIYKEILHRRGIIANTFCRAPGCVLDQWDRTELEEILSGVEQLFVVFD